MTLTCAPIMAVRPSTTVTRSPWPATSTCGAGWAPDSSSAITRAIRLTRPSGPTSMETETTTIAPSRASTISPDPFFLHSTATGARSETESMARSRCCSTRDSSICGASRATKRAVPGNLQLDRSGELRQSDREPQLGELPGQDARGQSSDGAARAAPDVLTARGGHRDETYRGRGCGTRFPLDGWRSGASAAGEGRRRRDRPV